MIAPRLSDAGRVVPRLINHLLARDAWARDALRVHSGKSLVVEASPARIHLLVTPAGLTELGDAANAASVRITTSLAALPRWLAGDRRGALTGVRIEGDASFAQTVSDVASRLRWDPEEDLSHYIGDIAAERVGRGARAVLGDVRVAGRKVAENLSEFWLEEDPLLVRPRHVETLAAGLRTLRDTIARLEKRVERLERH